MELQHPERRQRTRGTLRGEPTRVQLQSLILGMYREMPGLSLTLPQAARLFGLRYGTCQIVLEDLVRDGLLLRGDDRQYRQAGS